MALIPTVALRAVPDDGLRLVRARICAMVLAPDDDARPVVGAVRRRADAEGEETSENFQPDAVHGIVGGRVQFLPQFGGRRGWAAVSAASSRRAASRVSWAAPATVGMVQMPAPSVCRSATFVPVRPSARRTTERR